MVILEASRHTTARQAGSPGTERLRALTRHRALAALRRRHRGHRRDAGDGAELQEVCTGLGATLTVARVGASDGSPQHDVELLAAVLGELARRSRGQNIVDGSGEMPDMAMTAAVKDGFSRLPIHQTLLPHRPRCRQVLRFAGGLHIVAGRSSSRPSSTPAPPRVASAATSPRRVRRTPSEFGRRAGRAALARRPVPLRRTRPRRRRAAGPSDRPRRRQRTPGPQGCPRALVERHAVRLPSRAWRRGLSSRTGR